MFHLSRLKIRGFRGFVDEQEFLFDKPVVLLCGENHRGKSSTLNGIEWCLFGDECIGKKTGIRERIDWEIANRYLPSGGVAVTVEFSGPKGVYTVTREQGVAKRRGAKRVAVVLPDSTELQNEDAEAALYTLFHSSFQDFMTTVYQHQEAIRAILTQEPRERNEAIDRLLGLAPYRELLRGITGARVEHTLASMKDRREEFRRRCEHGIQTLDKLIRDEKAKAEADGIKETDITEREALHRAKGIVTAVSALARELGITDFEVKTPTDFAEIGEFREHVKNEIDNLWSKSPDVLKQENLGKEQTRLAPLKGNYDTAKAAETKARGKRDNFIRQNGDEAALKKAIEDEQAVLDSAVKQIQMTNARANLVREATTYLKQLVPETTRMKCPLCGADVPDLLSHLEAEWEEKIREAIQNLEESRQQGESKVKQLKSLRADLQALEQDLETACSRLANQAKEIADALGRKVGPGDDPLALIDKRLQEIASELDQAQKAIESKRKVITDIYSQLARLRTIDEILNHKKNREIVERVWKTKEFSDLEIVINDAAQLVEDIAAIRSVLAEVSREEAEKKIRAAEAALDKYFCCIARHPAITGLVMDVTEDRRTGLNAYSFRGKDGTDPIPILSQGDLNCLALSLFLGLAEATGEDHRFAFLLLDDPTQSLGLEMKRELAAVLEEVADRRGLVIATPDTEFRDLLVKGITKNKASYNFASWNKENGPEVVREG